jgi:hypothetical protein
MMSNKNPNTERSAVLAQLSRIPSVPRRAGKRMTRRRPDRPPVVESPKCRVKAENAISTIRTTTGNGAKNSGKHSQESL